ncbi:MAG: 30S ribosomal protein S8e, partial [Candidatus Nanohaloarchaea archaeon]|nr:30S ribosomal protein S8e [Candidatus Nanohaloarchaea archaeon]
MAQRHTRSRMKPSGGRTRRFRKPRKDEQGGEFTATALGETAVEESDAEGNGTKTRVKAADTVNLAVDGDVKTAEIEAVLENPANPDYVRRDVLTKGSVVQTGEGKARITSRPGQDGSVDAVLL